MDLRKDQNIHINMVLMVVDYAKKINKCFSCHVFEKQMRQAGFYFYFLFPKKQMMPLFYFLFDQNTMRHLFLFNLSIKMPIF